MRSAAADTLQGRAIQDINIRWGEDVRRRDGRESIGMPVCKKKYSPFSFVQKRVVGRSPKGVEIVETTVKRMYGCRCHSDLRRKVIMKYGERKGWEPFGQWSMTKAKGAVRRGMEKMDDEGMVKMEHPVNGECIVIQSGNTTWKRICGTGSSYTWKFKEKFDDIFSELHLDCDEATIITRRPKRVEKPLPLLIENQRDTETESSEEEED